MYLGLDKGKNGGLSELRLSLAPFPLFVCSGKRNSYAWRHLGKLTRSGISRDFLVGSSFYALDNAICVMIGMRQVI